MSSSSLSSVAVFLKEHYSADKIHALVDSKRPFFEFAPAHVAPAQIAIPIAATMAIAGLGWVIARRNKLAAEERDSKPFWHAVAEWLAMLIAALFPRKTDAGEDWSESTAFSSLTPDDLPQPGDQRKRLST